MLARVAENLYWVGRYIERTEHLNRYFKVQFFSTLDAPMSQNRDFTLRSIMFMSGTNDLIESPLNEDEVWSWVLFDASNPNSIFTIIRSARENTRSIRNKVSTEMWESLNKCFLYCKKEGSTFSSEDIYHFTEQMTFHLAVVKSHILNTLLHQDPWNFISLGIFVERTQQILRILKSKISDASILSDNGANRALLQYQWTIMLKSLEAFDVHTEVNRGKMSQATIFELILSNAAFPRSLRYSYNHVIQHLKSISVRTSEYAATLQSMQDELEGHLHFEDLSSEESVMQQIDELSEKLSNLHPKIEKLYFQ